MSHHCLPNPEPASIGSMPPGRVELFSLTPLDVTGVPCWNAMPVRLPAGTAKRLGGSPWLNITEIGRIVGRLYPLYREPGVHSAPIVLERRP